MSSNASSPEKNFARHSKKKSSVLNQPGSKLKIKYVVKNAAAPADRRIKYWTANQNKARKSNSVKSLIKMETIRL